MILYNFFKHLSIFNVATRLWRSRIQYLYTTCTLATSFRTWHVKIEEKLTGLLGNCLFQDMSTKYRNRQSKSRIYSRYYVTFYVVTLCNLKSVKCRNKVCICVISVEKCFSPGLGSSAPLCGVLIKIPRPKWLNVDYDEASAIKLTLCGSTRDYEWNIWRRNWDSWEISLRSTFAILPYIFQS